MTKGQALNTRWWTAGYLLIAQYYDIFFNKCVIEVLINASLKMDTGLYGIIRFILDSDLTNRILIWQICGFLKSQS
jgi:hypothetical protein